MLDEQFIRKYLVEPSKQPKHAFYQDSIKINKALEAHSKDEYPKDLIEIVRPNETADQKQYRKSVYTAKTKTYFSKVVTTLAKIQRAEDWRIKFEDSKSAFEKTYPLMDYTESKYPFFGSVSNWFFSVQLRQMCDDPNGVIAVLPLPKANPTDDTELLQPFTYWFPSASVIDFVENSYCVLKSDETTDLKNNKTGEVSKGVIYYFIDTDSFSVAKQYGDPRDFSFTTETAPHPVGKLPAFKIGGLIEEFKNGQKLYDSFLGDCLPDWNEALRRYSDLQVQMVLHVHSEKWEIEDSPCKVCNETGMVNKDGRAGTGTARIACGNCGGTGNVASRSPFNVKLIKPSRQTGLNDNTPIPTPPMGYIQKPIEDTKFIDDKVNDSIESGLAAINMEFLMFEPEVNSGVAKSLDRQEVNTFFYEVGRHIVKNILDPAYYMIAKWRYSMQLTEEQLNEALPEINVPTKFDILSEDILFARLQAAITAGVDPSLIMSLQIEWAKREFGEDSKQAQFIKCISSIDPLPSKTDDQKMTILSNKGTTQENYILSCNLTPFIIRAEEENEDFYELEYADKMEILMGYVKEVTDAQDSAKVPIIQFPPAPAKEPVNNLEGTGTDG